MTAVLLATNHDGTKGVSGCIFCGEEGSGEQIHNRNFSVKEQINQAILSSKGSEKFIAYFQNFTNTYAELDVLKERFLPALKNEKIVGLSIATRRIALMRKKQNILVKYLK